MKLKLFLLLVLQPVLVFCQLCPIGWTIYDDSCYKLYTDLKTYDEARQVCIQQDGNLAMSKTTGVNALLTKLVTDSGVNALIGLHDLATEDDFYWVDGTQLLESQKNWNAGEPNNYGTGEDCVAIRQSYGTWIDLSCSTNSGYICERGNDMPLKCDESGGWYLAGTECFKYYAQDKTWKDADNHCRKVGGNLVTIQTDEEQNFVANQVSVKQKAMWLGLSDTIGGAEGNYKWTTGESLSYTKWATGEPDSKYYQAGGDCGTIMQTAKDGVWSIAVCTSAKHFICERPEGTCPTGWHLYRGYCYQFNIHTLNSWRDAKHTCEAQGAYLFTDLSATENSYIVDYMAAYTDVGVDTTWLGLSDTENDGHLQWVQKSTIGYTNWDAGMPDQTTGDDCAYVFTGDGGGKWSTGSCTIPKSFVCKVIAGTPISALDPNIGIGTCDDGWTLSGMYCYYFDYVTRFFNDAEEQCVQQRDNAHLTSIIDQGEQNFIAMRARLGGAELWIGLHDTNTEGAFSWTDGQPLGFQKWAPGQPDNWQSVEDSVYVRTWETQKGYWNDIDGTTNKRASICKKSRNKPINVDPTVHPTPTFDPRCGNGWDFDVTSQNCYLFRYSDYKSWLDAREYCRVQGGDLASITSAAEQAYMNGRLLFTAEADVWIGGTDINREGGWEWSDGSGFSYLNWNENEPNNANDGEHCMEIFTDRDTWNDNGCEVQRGYVCKKTGYLTTHFNIQPHTYMSGPGILTLSNVYPNECGQICVMNTVFVCKSFNYNRVNHECTLNDAATSTPLGDGNMDYYQRLMEVVDPVPTTLGPGFRCPDGWSSYGDNCYSMYTISELTYDGLQSKCHDLGGNLASIHSENENSFIQALAKESGVTGNEEIWIGLNDKNSKMTFQWEDNTPVDYTLWNKDEPNNYQGLPEDCVELYTNGYWNDISCAQTRKGVCKRPKENLGPTQFPVTPSGCRLGEIANGGSCLTIQTTPMTWQDARDDCATLTPRGNLMSIADRFEQSVLSSLLGSQDGTLFWIGLNDQDVQGEYEWSDNTPVTFSNWDYAQPDDTQGRCVASSSGLLSGFWKNVGCDSTYNYLCERGRTGYPAPSTIGPTVLPTPPSDRGCYDDKWKGYGGNCFMIVQNDWTGEGRRTWMEAQTYCEALGGNLASFHSQAEEEYIYNNGDGSDNVGYWLGLHDRSQESGFEWTDGTPVDHTNWASGEPNDYAAAEDCTEVYFTSRLWNDNSCWKLNNWICELPKGATPSYTTAPPPTPTPWPACASDPAWLRYTDNDYCYFFSHGLSTDAAKKDWKDANDFCMESGGYLVSIHSNEENAFIQNYLKRFGETESDGHTYLGLREYTVEGVYSWSDGTAVDYQNWVFDEPNDFNGEEQCGEFYHKDGTWNDVNCGKETYFICRKHFGSLQPITPPPTPEPIGNCQEGWLRFDNRCYKAFGFEEGSTNQLGWYEARDACKSIANTNLVTIHSHELQAYLNSQMRGAQVASWIGLSDTVHSGRFYWTDGSSVDYTNWNSGEPNNYGSGEDCTEMIAIENLAGKWNDMGCDASLGYICQSVLDPNAPAPPTDPPGDCREGFTQYDVGCYQVIDRPYAYSEAQAACQNLGADVYLGTITNRWEESFAETMSHTSGGDPLWIGLYSVNGEYQWSDGWPIWFTSWGPSEPSAAPGEGCVSLLPTGGWDDTACIAIFKPLCRYSLITVPTEHPEIPGSCPEDWSPYYSSCYKAFVDSSDWLSWPEAEFTCSTINASLASIHSRQESEFVYSLMKDGKNAWNGLTRGDDGGFMWSDESAVDYTNWESGEPSYEFTPGIEDCVEIYLSNGKWNDLDCLQTRGYVCKQPKSGMTLPSGEPLTQTGLASGAIAGIVIAALIIVCGIALVAFFISSRKGSLSVKSPMTTTDVPGSVGFDNALYKAGNDSTIQVMTSDPSSLDSKA